MIDANFFYFEPLNPDTVSRGGARLKLFAEDRVRELSTAWDASGYVRHFADRVDEIVLSSRLP